jgi:hypothetical protein
MFYDYQQKASLDNLLLWFSRYDSAEAPNSILCKMVAKRNVEQNLQ